MTTASRQSEPVAAAQRPLGGPRALGHAATAALHDELALSPKPGLVTPHSRGSHADMDAHTFLRSLFALRGYFTDVAQLGAERAPFSALEACGIAAEARMLAATGGVNTHRGAIFMLGLLCAAAGTASAAGAPASPATLRHALQSHWGASLAARARRTPRLPGGRVAQQLGLRGASAEAALGFPTLFEVAVPALQAAQAQGLDRRAARLQTLWAVIAVLDDSNLAQRGGLAGLRFAQDCARDFLADGGLLQPHAQARLTDIGRAFEQRRLSPGGAADTLAAVCWLQRIGALGAETAPG